MVNFANAIEQGISAATVARTEQQEINEVVKSLALSVESASSNAVTLTLTERALKTSNDLLNSLAFVLSGTKYHALVLKSKDTPPIVSEVAKWGQDGRGYPVKIGISSEEYNCPNREALERALLTLVATSEFGETMKRFVARSKSKIGDKVQGIAEYEASTLKSEVRPRASGTATAAQSAEKAVYKRDVKPAVKSSARSAVRPTTRAVKPAAADVAAKPAAKAAAAKPSAKAAAKPAAKTAAKPASQSAAKPSTRAIKTSSTKPRSRAGFQ